MVRNGDFTSQTGALYPSCYGGVEEEREKVCWNGAKPAENPNSVIFPWSSSGTVRSKSPLGKGSPQVNMNWPLAKTRAHRGVPSKVIEPVILNLPLGAEVTVGVIVGVAQLFVLVEVGKDPGPNVC